MNAAEAENGGGFKGGGRRIKKLGGRLTMKTSYEDYLAIQWNEVLAK